VIGRDHDPRGRLRHLTGRLAQLLATETGSLALAQIQQLTLLSGPRREPPPLDPGLGIGVWAPDVREDGTVEFVRRPDRADEWRYWADVERIPAKTGKRVVLLGESAARGYLYDPCVTPAGVLSAMLGVEVVDLARTDIGFDGLQSLFGGLVALEPEAIVFFAGNNWYNLHFDLDHLSRLAAALRTSGYADCRQVFVEEMVKPRARALLDALAESAAEFSVPVVLVVPEFNLLDWRSEPTVVAPVLPGDANLRWLDIRRRADAALSAGAPDDAAQLALELLALDGGTSAIAPELLAAARPGEARAWSERARDAIFGILIAHSPRCPSEVQALLRAQAAAHGFQIVDLPRIFESHLDGALPGRDFFLDYCHHTLTGMRVAMRAVADRLAPILGSAVQDDELAVLPEHEGLAHVMAAIHNAHYGQPDEILRYHCSRAAAISPVACDHMRWYLDCFARRAEPWLCESFARLCESAISRRYLLAPEVRSQKFADFRLMDAMARALDEAAGGDARANLERVMKGEHAPRDPVDLLAPWYSASTFRDRTGYALAPERAYYRALNLRSRFALVRAEAGAVRLAITCRATTPGEANVQINGALCARLSLQPAWCTTVVTVQAREGVNWIDVQWPPAAPREDELERAARRLERGLYPDVLPSYAEIHAFTATAEDRR
jgi:hypothetical protein